MRISDWSSDVVSSDLQPGDTAFGGDISGTGSFVEQGEGTLNLTGDSSYTGPTSVNGGTLAVNGSIVSPVTVNSGGTLGGNGSVGSTTVAGGGTLAPGNSIGRLTVNGDLAFAAGSTYEVEVNAAGDADRLDATGAVTIDSRSAEHTSELQSLMRRSYAVFCLKKKKQKKTITRKIHHIAQTSLTRYRRT